MMDENVLTQNLKTCSRCKHFTDKTKGTYHVCDITDFTHVVRMVKGNGTCKDFTEREKHAEDTEKG
ncbi:MAG: hypothetical protein MJZ20_05590 [Bacteroidaceae bacterium]|nr:hypothetical protein [Bacteroidaceae bacterium]